MLTWICSVCVGDGVGACIRAAGTGVSVFSLHPGVVQSDLWRHQHQCIQVAVKIFRVFTKTTVEGAQTTIYCAVEPSLDSQSGGYFRYTQYFSQLPVGYASQSAGFTLLSITTCWPIKGHSVCSFFFIIEHSHKCCTQYVMAILCPCHA